jgi:tetratricopeptide (TPR) repeat protein
MLQMIKRLQLIKLVLLSSLFLVGTTAVQAQVKDQIYLISNPNASVRGLIDSITQNEVIAQVDGVRRTLAANDIARIQFVDSPSEVLQAAAMYRRGQLIDARAELAKVDIGMIKNDFVKQDFAYMFAAVNARIALAGTGDKIQADKMLVVFLQEYADSYHYYEIVELYGDLAYAMGEFDKAANQYTILTKAPWEDLKIKGTLRLANSTVGKGDYAAALVMFEKVAAVTATTPLMQLTISEAKAGQARCLGETGEAEAGIALTNKLIKDNDPKTQKQLFAQAYNAQGVCYRRVKKPKEAILAFLHTHLIFNESADAHAESLYNLSELWSEVSKADRAQDSKRLLQFKYAGTFWEKKSRAE